MSIIVQTQHMENYGSEEGMNYWKFKWGSVYEVKGTDQRPANAVALVTHYIAKFNRNTNYAMEFVTDWYAQEEVDEVEKARLSSTDLFYNYDPLTNAPTVLHYDRYITSPTDGQEEYMEGCGCSSCTCGASDSTSIEERRTSSEWQAIKSDIKVIDPDGWDRRNFNQSWHMELITESEYEQRLGLSTCQFLSGQ